MKENYIIPSELIDWRTQWKSVRFQEDLEIKEIRRGRSAANFSAYSKTTNNYYTIFMVDLLSMMVAGKIKDCRITGTFKVIKRGRSLGICLDGVPNYKKEPLGKDFLNKDVNFPIPGYI